MVSLLLLISILGAPTFTATPEPPPCSAMFPTDGVELYPEQMWLSPDDFTDMLADIGITEAEIPSELGMPFLAVDWDHARGIADRGRMVSIGFEATHSRGSRWGALTVIYATYDFAIGAEYDTHAQSGDFSDLRDGITEADIILEDGIQGIVTYEWHPIFESIQQKIIFPFEDHYVAIVTYLNGDYNDDYKAVIDQLNEGDIPDDEVCLLMTVDSLAQSFVFDEVQFSE